MSIDKSLVLKSQLTRRRSVLSRTERLKVLTDDGRWNEGDSVFGLPKVRTFAARRKVKKEKVEEKEVATTTAAAEETSAEGKKSAKPAAKS